MPKNWPSDTVRRQKGRKTDKEVPSLPGWNYFEATSNLFLNCQKCRKLEREMFYRYVKEPGQTVGVTEAMCVSCGIKNK
jgi:hypothetical protein